MKYRHRLLSFPALLCAILSLFGMPPVSAESGTNCSWRDLYTGYQVGNRDLGATYWTFDFKRVPGADLVIEGTYPDARFFSLNVDQAALPGQARQPDSLYDEGIRPRPGSANPYTGPVDRHRKTYQVTVKFGAAPPVRPANTLYTGEPTAGLDPTYTFIYRIYAPVDAGSATGSVALPHIYWRTPNGGRVDPGGACAVQVPLPTSAPAPLAANPRFRRVSGAEGESANAIAAYMFAIVNSDFYVIHGKAETFPDTSAGEKIYNADANVRYWSFCGSYPITYWCAVDYSAALDADGYYTVVVSRAAERPANAVAQNGVIWREFGASGMFQYVILREIEAAPSFAFSAAGVPIGSTTQVAGATMGEYYPRIAYCDKATFETGGWNACSQSLG
jgi:hypothetical protein